jgi:hypothetical protein
LATVTELVLEIEYSCKCFWQLLPNIKNCFAIYLYYD